MDPNSLVSEKLLHYIWQFQRFNTQNLLTDAGQGLQIIQIGQLNLNAGPDFLESKIQIDDITWVGNIEIHLNANDWLNHNHQSNQDYDNVILHVVWENDKEITRKNGQKIPTLSLKNRVNNLLINKYHSLINNPNPIPCYSQFEQINSITKMLMLEKVLISRLERKAKTILESLQINDGDWEQTTYQNLAKTMGFGLNAIPFERLATLVPLKIVQKHNDNLFAIEALLFGVAGFLDEPIDEYTKALQKEYLFLKKKYTIEHQIGKHEWKFMRLRPANFPTVRIAQFAQLIQQTKSLFSYFLLYEDVEILKKMFQTKPNEYWRNHYRFGESSNEILNGIGKGSVDIILINAAAPIIVAYSMIKNDPSFIEKAMSLLEKLPAEKNKITKFWNELGLPISNGFDSQASIELHNEYCLKKACLSCNIGSALLK
jgi:Protein of unknown function (DUF2851)